MKCADPVLCYTKEDGKKIYRHFSHSSALHLRVHQSVFDCGKCLFCRKKRALELASRCVLHASLYMHNCFLTLTYDESKPEYHNNFEYADIQKFKKRFRAYCRRKYGKRIEVFNVHEYGKNGKKHWHLVVFNHQFDDRNVHSMRNGIPLYTSDSLGRLWRHGFSTIGDVSEASAMYTAQYMEKDFKHNYQTSKKKSHSRHSGIGKPYFLRHYKQILTLGYIPFGNRKMPVPRYFEKLAKKHWAHFYDTSYFFDLPWRKAHFRPFKQGEENKHIADLYIQFQKFKEARLLDLEKEWSAVISQYLTTEESPDFIKSASNALYDLRNKNNLERF